MSGFGNNDEILRADIPSVGTATAHGLAATYNAVLRGKLVDSAQLAELSALAFEGHGSGFRQSGADGTGVGYRDPGRYLAGNR